jgi:hypothetical protein
MDIQTVTNQIIDICDDYEPGTSKDRGKMYEEMTQRIYDLLLTSLTAENELALTLQAMKVHAEAVKTQVDTAVASLQDVVDVRVRAEAEAVKADALAAVAVG